MRRGGRIVIVEQAARKEPDPRGFDVAGIHGVPVRSIRLLGLRGGCGEVDAVLVALAAQRQLTGEPRGHDARHASNGVELTFVQPLGGRVCVVLVSDHLDLHGDQPVRIETDRHREQVLQRPEKQS